ncbi:hypothetical protein [Oerskovia sp. USHLN155]|uniref:hypothetical protein n=1 Tax=Oerskovia sp. USHLN155 TaxID=3081288 RepID=UPI00301A0180
MTSKEHAKYVYDQLMTAFDAHGGRLNGGRIPRWRGELASSIALATAGEDIEHLETRFEIEDDANGWVRGAVVTANLVVSFEFAVTSGKDDAEFVVQTRALSSIERVDVRATFPPNDGEGVVLWPGFPTATLVFGDSHTVRLGRGSYDPKSLLSVIQRLPALLS